MIKNKRIFIGIGAAALMVAPLVTTISCVKNNTIKPNTIKPNTIKAINSYELFKKDLKDNKATYQNYLNNLKDLKKITNKINKKDIIKSLSYITMFKKLNDVDKISITNTLKLVPTDKNLKITIEGVDFEVKGFMNKLEYFKHTLSIDKDGIYTKLFWSLALSMLYNSKEETIKKLERIKDFKTLSKQSKKKVRDSMIFHFDLTPRREIRICGFKFPIQRLFLGLIKLNN